MPIKFLTINIWFGGILWDSLVPYIHKEKPDILALQEVYDGHDKSLENRFRTMKEFTKEFSSFLPFQAFGATVIDTGNGNMPWGNAIFSKFPIKNSRTIFFDLPLTEYDFKLNLDSRLAAEGMLESEILIGEKNVFVYSWHGVWDHHGNDTSKREQMGQVIIENIKDKENIILAGDGNINHDTKVIKNIGNYLQNVFGDSLPSTFNMKYKEKKSTYATSSVDKVFLSKNLKVIKKEMPDVDISDHYPLLVEFEI
jgi:endonuclease/exonuclease/phosphatase family metal-dependent hydrolase